MDINEAKIFAAEYITDKLCSGKDFRGLGPEASSLVHMIAQPAGMAANMPFSQIPDGGFVALQEQCKATFVKNVLGFGQYIDHRGVVVKGAMTIPTAAAQLVDTVWAAYAEWAK